MDPLLLGALLATVFFANIYASSVGGASLLILPMMFLAGIPANIAVGTNRLHRVFATGTGAAKYLKNVKIDFRHLWFYAISTAIGAVVGAFIVVSIDKTALELIISIFLLALAVFFLVKKDFGMKEKKEKPVKKSLAFTGIAMFAISVYRSIFGSAAGTFLRVYLVVKDGLSFLQASAYASLIANIGNIFAVIIFGWAGIIDYWIALYMIIVGSAGSYIGAHLAIKKGNEFVRKIFLLLAIITSLRLIAGIAFGI
ncbi:MAG: sulfite exporter TauE/SafE family protein [Candidatus Diapherotrites archaeon]|uniref:Probable membrane transporter protein n=1 Tax=Candidatus Iainarchaeum sp. TaxID=3101447 RepID=A0A938YNM1_9ARCH|nr:sulfite exporter TauE/SafE family protein [Candidatus Diapherotrites archaeon]